MQDHELRKIIGDADEAINRRDFDALMAFYAEDATLVVKPGMLAKGKEQMRNAFLAISEYFNHSLVVRQGDMSTIEAWQHAMRSKLPIHRAGKVATGMWRGAGL